MDSRAPRENDNDGKRRKWIVAYQLTALSENGLRRRYAFAPATMTNKAMLQNGYPRWRNSDFQPHCWREYDNTGSERFCFC
jgi:hypothetical protein